MSATSTEPSLARSPDEIMHDLDQALCGRADIDAKAVIFELIDDIRSAYRLAIASHIGRPCTAVSTIDLEIDDYIANHYGDD
ncbi:MULTISPECIES: hypothetical protein [Gordonia]|uniref:hypothetical protein n=1 Tax=Gordonia TaxID=2053 RepID=UPI0005C9D45E|nr:MULTISPECIES: hypothetical protein [Gordonia]MCZ4580477.1 hypothetical protein [Gordonia amicalis]